jgi:hypothetical protein
MSTEVLALASNDSMLEQEVNLGHMHRNDYGIGIMIT